MSKSPYASRVPELSRNLSRVFARRTRDDYQTGIQWYAYAHAIVLGWSDRYSYAIATVANVVAAVSPQCEWSRNLLIAEQLLEDMNGPVTYGALPPNVAKARDILRDRYTGRLIDRMPYGYKVDAFARNLAGDLSAVTVDTHAIQAAHDDVLITMTLKRARYDHIADAYARAAKRAHLESADFQSVVWHIWKREHPTEVKKRVRQQWHPIAEVA